MPWRSASAFASTTIPTLAPPIWSYPDVGNPATVDQATRKGSVVRTRGSESGEPPRTVRVVQDHPEYRFTPVTPTELEGSGRSALTPTNRSNNDLQAVDEDLRGSYAATSRPPSP